MSTVWSFPTRILFGAGTVSEAGKEAKQLGATKVLIVTDTGVKEAGLVEPLAASLTEAGIGHDVFHSVSSNPTEKELLEATAAYKSSNADLVIGLGGGSPLDVAKLVRVMATHPPPVSEYDDATGGDAKITKPLPNMIAIPTTAGTGSEVGRAGVVTLEATGKKTVIFAPSLMPTVAILDPALTTSMPTKMTAATGFDALTHCIEAYCAIGDHPMADAIAIKGIRLVAKHLLTAVNEGDDLEARGGMMRAAMMGAVAFQKGLGACHSLAHPLSAEHGMHHGLANALCLPAVLDFNRSVIGARIATIASILGVRGDDKETLAFECAGAVRAFRRKAGLPEGLGAAGIESDSLEALAKLALEDGCHALNPRPCTEEDMLALYRAAM